VDLPQQINSSQNLDLTQEIPAPTNTRNKSFVLFCDSSNSNEHWAVIMAIVSIQIKMGGGRLELQGENCAVVVYKMPESLNWLFI